MTVKMILCTGVNGELGKDNKLLTHIPEDLAYFKKITSGHVVLMGNTTYKSLPFKTGLPERVNVVLSREKRESTFLQPNETMYIDNLSSFLEWGVMYAKTILQKDTWVIGGATVYEQIKPHVQEIHWTQVDKAFSCADTFFDMSWVLDKEVFYKESSQQLCEGVVVSVYKRK
jgi:dihydrofolate reductase